MNVDELFGGIVLPEKWRVLEEWDQYMALVRRIEDDPSNQPGSDKSWVERAARHDRDFFENLQRVR